MIPGSAVFNDDVRICLLAMKMFYVPLFVGDCPVSGGLF
jgi:hypothetical protein